MKLPEDRQERFKFLHENKSTLIVQKKSEMKKADGISIALPVLEQKKFTPVKSNGNVITVKVVINTTNVLDSHGDVHIPGLWDKSLKENRNILFLQEHQMAFDKIIADGDNLKASAKKYTFKELGFDLPGTTQALIFDANIEKSRNEFMFDQYSKGYVKEHSVGMQYVKLYLAINSDDYPEEKSIWDKYFSKIANQDKAEAAGYFWAVTEAKTVEGSAVPLGSNSITPTISTGAGKATPHQPPIGTEKKLIINLLKSI